MLKGKKGAAVPSVLPRCGASAAACCSNPAAAAPPLSGMTTKLEWGRAAGCYLRGRSCRGVARCRTMLLRAGLWGRPRPAGVQPRQACSANLPYLGQGWAAEPQLSGI